ncbi:cytochrome P450 [Amycolatopsis rhabdoformis]|uniref:Cytochrome P450 n=1 Tax=Amycolatopsis rhabdoformis TaxID=1448059 RepID=A0ABZ1HYV0_9PSEU|nr:cytochrome P450 [Amycolatopsis rhabdoformis]WSE27367.1 cytochrome P450 [Amycolatopsis rhabdoformis]
MSEMLDHEVPSFPMARECPMRPPAEYREIRKQEPVSRVRMPDGQPAWLVANHELARKLLADPRVSSDRRHPAFPGRMTPEQRTAGERVRRLNTRRSMIFLDPPDHGNHRRMLVSEFSLRRIAALRPRVQEIVDRSIDNLLAAPHPADLVEHVSLAVPSLVICELLGVPYEQRDSFHEWARKLVDRTISVQERTAASEAINHLLETLVIEKEQSAATDDLIGRLIARNRETPVLTRDEIVGTAVLLLIAGHQSTANMISLGVVALLENPEQKAQVMADPSLLPSATDEMLRYFSIGENLIARVAAEDIELGGVTIRKDEGIVVSGLAADWDDEVFANPERLDFHRDSRHHIAFGYGMHQCLGQNLARVELEIVFETLFRRLPNLSLAVPADELPYKNDAAIFGIYQVPVNF